MHRKYAKDGLVAITLNLDPLKDPADGKDVSAEAKASAHSPTTTARMAARKSQSRSATACGSEKSRVILQWMPSFSRTVAAWTLSQVEASLTRILSLSTPRSL